MTNLWYYSPNLFYSFIAMSDSLDTVTRPNIHKPATLDDGYNLTRQINASPTSKTF